jgi:DNA-binding CsgD family transcriptional regulator/tetratricopeptide (TPR) repeat protein
MVELLVPDPDNADVDARVSSPIFIGRTDELARLRAAIEIAGQGRSTKFVLSGEAGVGKTRLTSELADLARRDGALVLSGGCVDVGDGGIAFGPIVEALRTWARGTPADELDRIAGAGRASLARLIPDLRSDDGQARAEAAADAASAAGALDVGSAQGTLFEHILALLERLAERSPVLLVIEDLHWSDRSTRDLLAFLVRNLRDTGVVLLMTYRSDELHRRHPLLPFLAELDRSGRVERLDLRRFDGGELSAQLRAINGREVEPGLVESIHARSHGNPFFAEELLCSARDTGTAELPPTLRDVLLARVARLTDATQEVLRVASAAGQHVDPALLVDAAGIDAQALYTALREAVGQHVLVPEASAGDEQYAFRHALLQEAIYDDLLPGERTRLHAAFARSLEQARANGDDTRLAELAWHWYAAHDLPRAFDASLAAAGAAEARYAFPEALAHYERALELWDQVPGAEVRASRDRVDLHAAAAGVARFTDPTRAVDNAKAALALVDADAEPIRAGLLYERLGRYAWIAGLGAQSIEAHRTAVRLIPADPPTPARARVLAGLAAILMLQRGYLESRVVADEAIAMARSTGTRQIEGHALNTRADDRVHEGEVEEALEDMAEAMRIARETANLDDIGRAYANIIDVLEVAGRLEEALAAAFEGLEATRKLGLLSFFGTHLLCNAGSLLYRLGRWDEADTAVIRADEIGASGVNEILVREMRARLALARGQFEMAAEELRTARPMAERAADGQVIGPVHASLAELALWQHRPAEAAEVIETGILGLAHSSDMRYVEVWTLGVRAYADLADVARARRSTADTKAAIAAGNAIRDGLRRRLGDSVPPALAGQAELWMLLAEAEARRLEGVADPDAWATAAQAWADAGRPYPAAYARWREAEAAMALDGDRRRASAAIAFTLETAAALGASPLEREAASLVARARLTIADEPDIAPAEPGPAVVDEAARFGLTARERDVLALVALGRTNRQIGEALFITENTAGVHVSNILSKFGVSGRGEAAAMAYHLGLVDPAAVPMTEDALD